MVDHPAGYGINMPGSFRKVCSLTNDLAQNNKLSDS